VLLRGHRRALRFGGLESLLRRLRAREVVHGERSERSVEEVCIASHSHRIALGGLRVTLKV